MIVDENRPWDVSLHLNDVGDRTELRFVMHRIDPSSIGDTGPGWEYSLDQLVAAISGTPLPNVDDCYPALKEYFEEQAP